MYLFKEQLKLFCVFAIAQRTCFAITYVKVIQC